jgi:hypothetical protein
MLAALWYIYAADIWSAAGFDGLNGTTADGVRAALSLEISSQHLSLKRAHAFFSPTESWYHAPLNLRWNSTPANDSISNIHSAREEKTAAHASDFPQAHASTTSERWMCDARLRLWAWVNGAFASNLRVLTHFAAEGLIKNAEGLAFGVF